MNDVRPTITRKTISYFTSVLLFAVCICVCLCVECDFNLSHANKQIIMVRLKMMYMLHAYTHPSPNQQQHQHKKRHLKFSALTRTAFILKSIKFFTSAVSSRNSIMPFLRITSPSKSLYFCSTK